MATVSLNVSTEVLSNAFGASKRFSKGVAEMTFAAVKTAFDGTPRQVFLITESDRKGPWTISREFDAVCDETSADQQEEADLRSVFNDACNPNNERFSRVAALEVIASWLTGEAEDHSPKATRVTAALYLDCLKGLSGLSTSADGELRAAAAKVLSLVGESAPPPQANPHAANP